MNDYLVCTLLSCRITHLYRNNLYNFKFILSQIKTTLDINYRCFIADTTWTWTCYMLLKSLQDTTNVLDTFVTIIFSGFVVFVYCFVFLCFYAMLLANVANTKAFGNFQVWVNCQGLSDRVKHQRSFGWTFFFSVTDICVSNRGHTDEPATFSKQSVILPASRTC